eukprot:COSAG05_NODE_5497_length_1158_cov_338.242682_3_plen_133_part_00
MSFPLNIVDAPSIQMGGPSVPGARAQAPTAALPPTPPCSLTISGGVQMIFRTGVRFADVSHGCALLSAGAAQHAAGAGDVGEVPAEHRRASPAARPHHSSRYPFPPVRKLFRQNFPKIISEQNQLTEDCLHF